MSLPGTNQRSDDLQLLAEGLPVPWPVEAIRTAADGTRLLPERAAVVLVVRVGKPHGRARGGWRKEVRFDVGEGYAVFKEKCLAKFAEVSATPEAVRRPIELPEDVDIYLKRHAMTLKKSTSNSDTTILWRLCSIGGSF
ncbi:hypothetical protein V7S43_014165 [Phytophthora oleae]|uniref:Uncharacterized protein n=1 Tax=Phytophthora oleae TaxID=2107226 RepID=A0ABD3F2P0_9STRA